MESGVEEDEEEWKAPCSKSLALSLLESSNTTCSSAPYSVIAHFDMDCFYAQVEMIRNPALRNVPLGVQQKYIIVTCNYVARERGVTKLMSVIDAKEKCPELVLVKGEDLTHYREMSYKVTELLASYCPLVERLGFDENFMDITEMVERRLQQSKTCSFKGHVYNNSVSEDKARIYPWLAIGSHIAAELREAIHSKLGLTGCAGIATNKLLAKLVSGTFKPNQQTTLLPEDVSSLMGSLNSLRKVPGIGHQTAKRLQALGVASIKDLELFPLDHLVREFGEPSARRLKNLAVGTDDSSVTPTGEPQSLSDEDSFKKMSSTKEVIEKIQELLKTLVERMHNDGRQPQTLRLTIRRYSATNKWFNRESRQSPIPNHIGQKIVNGKFDDAVVQLKPLAMKLFQKMVDTNKAFHLTLINMCFSNLQARVSTSASGKSSLMSFFRQSPSPKKTKTGTAWDQGDSNSSEGRCNVDESNPHSSITQQISKEETVDFNLTNTENSFTRHSGLNTGSKQEETSSPEITLLPPNIDPEVLRSLPREIQMELMQFNTSTDLLYKNVSALPEVHSPKKPTTTLDPIRPWGSVSGHLKTEDILSLPGSSDVKMPGNVDPTVFAELPPELQKELMSEWRQDKPVLKAPSSKKPTKNVTGKDKKTTEKGSQSNNLLKYFKPH
ncbi:DNA polymerase iota isoform X3 [Boleophthalmus pectinirostris]|uniref:DNA polymerase iota isoform X3 n=1 Tax=Boleophthalmus pectinirostris TaxID=150288 RepID=UPI000A1C4BDF|nr:DNA polymerase iota isoform X3 [Boleophthalmus pectinirostris]